MNKTAIKNFAIWARRALIRSTADKCAALGITETGIESPLSQSTKDIQFFSAGSGDPVSITGKAIGQRQALVNQVKMKERDSDYKTAYQYVVEQVAYTWFNRLIAIRFMEVNDYLPSRIRVLSSEQDGKLEPDIVSTPFDTDLEFTAEEEDRIHALRESGQMEDMDALFRLLFIKQCGKLHEVLPGLFQKIDDQDYSQLLLNISFTDREGVVYHLVHDIAEKDFNIEQEGQVEIIGWMYQYYNTEPKDETFALLKKNVKITKERIPAATQLFTPDWIVRYMVENSLGRLWLEGHPNPSLREGWKYYLDEAAQEPDVEQQLEALRAERKNLNPEDIKVIDPCMGSGHILVYAFDVLMEIYESCGYTQRDAARSIISNNLYGLDIDDRAYQLAYFAVMMKARQYDRRALTQGLNPHVYAIQSSVEIRRSHLDYFGATLDVLQKNNAKNQIDGLIDVFRNAKDLGSILNVPKSDWQLLHKFVSEYSDEAQMSFDTVGIEESKVKLNELLFVAEILGQKYSVVITNPPYMGSRGGMNATLYDYVNDSYPNSKADLYSVFIERCSSMTLPSMYYAMITQHGWMFLTSFSELRNIVLHDDIVNLHHLGPRAFDEISGEVVQSVSFVNRKTDMPEYKGTYTRLLNGCSEAEKERMSFDPSLRFFVKKSKFCLLSEKSIAYWLSEQAFQNFSHPTLGEYVKPRQGMATSDNDRFLRFWYEIEIGKMCKTAHNSKEAVASNAKWFPYNKGGGFRKWYGNNDYVINWENDGLEVKGLAEKLYRCVTRTIKNIQFYFQQGVTWSTLASGSFNARYSGYGFLFDTKGSTCFFDDETKIPYFTSFLNSSVANEYLKVLAPTLDYNAGSIAKLPVIYKPHFCERIEPLFHSCIQLAKQDWDAFDTSWDFKKHPLVQQLPRLADVYSAWEQECQDRFTQLKGREEELNRIFIDIYSLQNELNPAVEDKDVTVRKADLSRDIRTLLSYAVGCIFGRYSLDEEGLAYAGGKWDSNKYSSFIPDADNVIPITDAEYLEDDVVGLLCVWLKKTYGEDTLEDNLEFIAKALGNKGTTSREVIRNYFLNDFFKDHCKVYQKRPIYWLYDSGKQNGFKALIYMHRYNQDTTGKIRVEYLFKMQKIYENELKRVQDTIDNNSNAREVSQAEKRKEKLTKQLKETRDYDQKIAHLALARIPIDLDDGVKTNYEKVQTAPDGKRLEVLAPIK